MSDLYYLEQNATQHANRCVFLSDFPHDWNSEKNGFIKGVEFAQKWKDIVEVEDMPPYYSEVIVECENNEGLKEHYIVWLSVDDDGEYVWTVYGTDIILTKEVIRWRFLSVC